MRGAGWILECGLLHEAGIITYHTVFHVSWTIHMPLGQQEVEGQYPQQQEGNNQEPHNSCLSIISFWGNITGTREIVIAQSVLTQTHQPPNFVLALRHTKPGQLLGVLAWPAAELSSDLATSMGRGGVADPSLWNALCFEEWQGRRVWGEGEISCVALSRHHF